ncbi:MAG: hypothetical protein H6Q90_6733 [Deltaproteobacteria bacterium]|nr:hypothetical protein [Deltaproteobacteria bacterium]
MPTPSTEQRPTPHAIGELCVGGDWACAHGDLAALRHVAQRLAVHAREPVHCELLDLAEACNYDPDHAVELWVRIKDRVLHASDA